MSRRTPPFPPSETRRRHTQWIRTLAKRLDDPGEDRNEVVRETLCKLYFGSDVKAGDPNLDPGVALRVDQMDPRNITLEAEYYGEMDEKRFYANKPLLWLWRMFDRTPAGHNVYLGILFRRMLASRVFGSCGEGITIFQDVEFSFGYNIHCGDRVSIHRKVLIDDRGVVRIGDGASLSDYVNVYTHTHDVLDINKVTVMETRIEADARLTYHSTILAGGKIGHDGMVGSFGLATRTVAPHHVALGIPAKPVRVKDRSCPLCQREDNASD